MDTKSNENVNLKTKELSFFQKFLQSYWVSPKRLILDEFMLEDGFLTVKTKNGNTLQAPLSKISSKYFVDRNGRRNVHLKDENGNKLRFQEIPWTLTDEEWELILSILAPKESTFNKIASSVTAVTEFFEG